MKIAFYAPMKPPDHLVPSGDRLMARQLIAALERAGHEVAVASHLRAYLREPLPDAIAALHRAALAEVARLTNRWATAAPDLWFCYHPYYKSPDLIGPALAARFGMAYVTAESSLARKVLGTGWETLQDRVQEGVAMAAVNICLTARDRPGLLAAVPDARIAMLPPFLDTKGLHAGGVDAPVMVAVAMMRPGDKLRSYAMLAQAVALLPDALPWRLRIVGDGPAADDVRTLFAPIDPARIDWLGQCSAADVAAALRAGGLYVWPGYAEAYGLAYLEAQAAGLPVVAQNVAGVPEVVDHGTTGLLSPPDDVTAFAQAIQTLLADPVLRRRMGHAAREFVVCERSPDAASARLNRILHEAVVR